MRAKENFEVLKAEIYYTNHVKKAVYELHKLRTDKIETITYFNKYLFSDARYRHLRKLSNGCFQEVEFKLRENELDHNIVGQVRNELLSVIYNDDTFIYAYNIIVKGINSYDRFYGIPFCIMKEENANTDANIEDTIKSYKEDYPKSILGDYLLDANNWEFYESMNSKYQKEDDWWLNAFNHAYKIFDVVRIKFFDPSVAQYIIKNVFLSNKELEDLVIQIVKNLFCNYTFHLTDDQKMKYAMICKKISEYEKKSFVKIDSKYLINSEKLSLNKINWLTATKKFNYQIIELWVKSSKFNQEQKFDIIDLIEKRYLKEKEIIPDILIYDLSPFFLELKEKVAQNYVAESYEIETYNSVESQYRSKNLEAIIEEQQEKINELQGIINSFNDNPEKGISMPQRVLITYYLFNELGITFQDYDRTDFADFLKEVSGFNYQNIRNEFSINFESSRVKKNLIRVAKIFETLHPGIAKKMINDSKNPSND